MDYVFDMLIAHSCARSCDIITRSFPGVIELGNGAFSTVYADDTDKVLKICKRDDDGWLTFGLYCMNNPSMHLPVVHDVHIFEDGTYIALIKRYDDFTPQEAYEEDTPCFMGAVTYPELNITAAFDCFVNSEQEVNSYAELTSMLMADAINNSLQVEGWTDVNLLEVESMIHALYTLWVKFNKDFAFDCHTGNFMLDKATNTVIISDPLSYII